MFVATLKTLAPRLQLKLDKPNIENMAFRLHYQLTVTFLLLCGLIVCARELLGEHVKCFSEHVNTDKFGGWINNYCFFMSTFTIVSKEKKATVLYFIDEIVKLTTE